MYLTKLIALGMWECARNAVNYCGKQMDEVSAEYDVPELFRN